MAEIVSGASNRAPAFEIRPIPGEDLIPLDDDVVAAVDPLDPQRPIPERFIDALATGASPSSLPRRRPGVSAVRDPCLAAVRVGLGSTWAEPRCHTNGWDRRNLDVGLRSSEGQEYTQPGGRSVCGCLALLAREPMLQPLSGTYREPTCGPG